MKIAPQTDARVKAIMDWGYRHGVMLTQSQVDDLIASIGAALPRLADLPDLTPKGKYDGQPEHAQRGWQPK